MIIIDHGHKNKCEFQHITIGEPFRGCNDNLYIKLDSAYYLKAQKRWVNCVRLCDGSLCHYNSQSIVYTVKAHIEVD